MTLEDADVVIDTTDITPEEGAQQVYHFLFLEKEGYVGPPDSVGALGPD